MREDSIPAFCQPAGSGLEWQGGQPAESGLGQQGSKTISGNYASPGVLGQPAGLGLGNLRTTKQNSYEGACGLGRRVSGVPTTAYDKIC